MAKKLHCIKRHERVGQHLFASLVDAKKKRETPRAFETYEELNAHFDRRHRCYRCIYCGSKFCGRRTCKQHLENTWKYFQVGGRRFTRTRPSPRFQTIDIDQCYTRCHAATNVPSPPRKMPADIGNSASLNKKQLMLKIEAHTLTVVQFAVQLARMSWTPRNTAPTSMANGSQAAKG